MTTQTWEIDSSHSGIHFSVRHLVIAKVRGQFSRWTGALGCRTATSRRRTVEVDDRRHLDRDRRRRPRRAPEVGRLLRRREASRSSPSAAVASSPRAATASR